MKSPRLRSATTNPLLAARSGQPQSRFGRVRSLAVCGIGASVDAALAEPVFEHGLRLPTVACWAVSGGFALLALHGSLRAGTLLRYRAWLPAAAAMLAPGAIAGALFALRLNADQFVVVQQSFEGSAPPTHSGTEALLAPVMLLAFIATAILATVDGWWHADPLACLRAQVLGAEADVALRRGRVARHLDEVARHVDDLRRLPELLRTALAGLDAVFATHRETARLRMAERLGDPRVTSGAHLPPPSATAHSAASTE